MPELDSMQVQLKLTKVPFVLEELRRKRRLTRDRENEEVFKIQFDSKTFEFKKDRIITVGKTIADCLIADAFVIVGPPIDGEVNPVLEVVREFNLGEGIAATSPTTCSFCHEDQGTVKALAAHLLDEHSEEEEEVEAEQAHPPARLANAAKAAASVNKQPVLQPKKLGTVGRPPRPVSPVEDKVKTAEE